MAELREAAARSRGGPGMRRGLGCGFAAYLMWGFFPLYFPLVEPASSLEILAQRMAWSLVVVLLLVAATRRWAQLRAVLRSRHAVLVLSAAAVFVTVNWGVYIYAVNNGHVVDASLGYFINPLLTILLGVFVLKERLRRAQWAAVAVASGAIVVLSVGAGGLPWISLVLAVSFALYGLASKRAAVEAVESLAVQTGVLFVPALVTLAVLAANGTLVFGHHGAGNAALLAGTGVVTALPLLLFAAAAQRLPLSVVGLMQYLTPVLQFGVGILVRHETMTPQRWTGFALVWIALAVLTVDALRSSHRTAVVDAVPLAAPLS